MNTNNNINVKININNKNINHYIHIKTYTDTSIHINLNIHIHINNITNIDNHAANNANSPDLVSRACQTLSVFSFSSSKLVC